MEVNEPLTDEEEDELQAILERQLENIDLEEVSGRPPIFSLPELDGFLTAVVSGPEALMPSTWLPEIFSGDIPEWETQEQAERFMSLVFRHMNGIAATLMEDPEIFEPLHAVKTNEYGEEEEFPTVWCMGYMRAVGINQSAWIEMLGEPVSPGNPLFPMLFLGTDLFIKAREQEDIPEEEFDNLSGFLEGELTESARQVHRTSLNHRRSPSKEGVPFGMSPDVSTQQEPVRRSALKVGRNDPCPCGSGLKFKKCCLQ